MTSGILYKTLKVAHNILPHVMLKQQSVSKCLPGNAVYGQVEWWALSSWKNLPLYSEAIDIAPQVQETLAELLVVPLTHSHFQEGTECPESPAREGCCWSL